MTVQIHVSPSGLERAWECTGFPFLAEGLPKPPQSEAAARGQMAHKIVLGAVAQQDPSAVLDLASSEDCSFEQAQVYEGHATALLQLFHETAKEGEKPGIEVKLAKLQELGMIPSGREGEHQADMAWLGKECWQVLDYKSGSVEVEVKGNKQLMSYAWAVAKEVGILSGDAPMRLWIFQPEVSPTPTSWLVPMAQLRKFGSECAGKILEMEEGGQLATGEWCTWCPVARAGACPLVKQNREQRKETQDKVKTQAAEMTEALSDVKSTEQRVGEIVNLPKTASDIAIPQEVLSAVQAALEKEQGWLAVDKGNASEASEHLKLVGTLESKLEDVEMLTKRPYAEAKKAVEDAFRAMRDGLKASKLSLKNKISSHLTIEENKRQAEIKRQKDEQDRLARELAAKEEAAKKLKGAAAAKAEKEAQQLRNQAAEASVVHTPAPAKVAGVSAKTVWTFLIQQVGKIPERYLLKHEGELEHTGTKALVIVEVDFATMAKDATAGRLDKADWVTLKAGTGVSAR